MVQDFTTNFEDIQNRLTFTKAKGRTALLDAVHMSLNKTQRGRNPRKALLIISDCADNSSRYTESEIKKLVRETDVQIYAIGIFEPIGSRERTVEELSGPGLLSELAKQTGGRHFAVENLNELPAVAARIGIELRNQVHSCIHPDKPGTGRKVSQGTGQIGTAEQSAISEGILETWILCACSINRFKTGAAIALAMIPLLCKSRMFRLRTDVLGPTHGRWFCTNSNP